MRGNALNKGEISYEIDQICCRFEKEKDNCLRREGGLDYNCHDDYDTSQMLATLSFYKETYIFESGGLHYKYNKLEAIENCSSLLKKSAPLVTLRLLSFLVVSIYRCANHTGQLVVIEHP